MTGKEIDLLCIGNALVDVFAGAEAGANYGLTEPVQHIEIEKILEIISLCKSGGENPPVICSGGGAANVAKVAACLGAKVNFLGAIGAGKTHETGVSSGPDEFGMLFESELREAGVELNLPLKPAPTGICLYLGEGEEKRVAASPSAALELSESDIKEDDIRRARILVLDGFILNKTGLVRHILELADKYGTIIAIDMGSAAIAGEHAAEIADYARRYSLILFMNEEEAANFHKSAVSASTEGTGNREPSFERIYSFFQSFSGKGPVTAVKRGGLGAICFAGGKSFLAETEAVFAQETTGAGDAFCAAFLYAYVRNKTPHFAATFPAHFATKFPAHDFAECAAFGNRAARLLLDSAGTKLDKEKMQSLAGIFAT